MRGRNGDTMQIVIIHSHPFRAQIPPQPEELRPPTTPLRSFYRHNNKSPAVKWIFFFSHHHRHLSPCICLITRNTLSYSAPTTAVNYTRAVIG